MITPSISATLQRPSRPEPSPVAMPSRCSASIQESDIPTGSLFSQRFSRGWFHGFCCASSFPAWWQSASAQRGVRLAAATLDMAPDPPSWAYGQRTGAQHTRPAPTSISWLRAGRTGEPDSVARGPSGRSVPSASLPVRTRHCPRLQTVVLGTGPVDSLREELADRYLQGVPVPVLVPEIARTHWRRGAALRALKELVASLPNSGAHGMSDGSRE